ncbi:dihydrofolate reductase [Halorhabdus amylolytica]|uniref:dihydrofolate reductase n=1 Tax=Halorhabdus amylolytica TaxID=2559573 RepID=UPI0010AAE1EA|nr:dihydrofolate reductase [Halorhabdus amylolytica]
MDAIAVAAVAENGVIGDGPTLPWTLPEEVRRYRERVAGETVAIGRRTFEMFDDPPGARRIVLSRTDREYEEQTLDHAGSVEEAIELARDGDAPVLYVLGGAEIYEAFLPHYDRMLLSRIDGEYDGDARFPDFDEEEWGLVDERRYDGYTLETWVPAEPSSG